MTRLLIYRYLLQHRKQWRDSWLRGADMAAFPKKEKEKKEHRMRTIKKYSPQFPLMGGKEAGVFLVVGEASKT